MPMVVSDAVKDDAADLRKCPVDGAQAFYVPQKVMVLSKGGARSMRLWACEQHPLPATITDDPNEGP